MRLTFFVLFSLFVFISAESFAAGVDKDQESNIYQLLKGTPTCSLDEETVEKFSWPKWFMGVRGHCFGFTSLWLYSKWLQVRHPEQVNSSEHDWFRNTVADILGVNCDEKKSNNCRMRDCDQVKKIASLVDTFQYAFSETDLARKMSRLDTGGKTPKMEYSIASLFTLDQLRQLLKENIIYDHKLIYIISPKHVSGLFKDNTNYHYYDPNNSVGEMAVHSTNEVADLIFSAHDFDAAKPSPLLFVMVSLDGEKEIATYPSQKEILDRINPIFVGTSQYADGWAGLHIASMWGCLESIKYFLGKGADPNIVNDDGLTALMIASTNDRRAVVETLLKNGAEVDQATGSHKTALIYAAKMQHYEVVKSLLTFGANPKVADYDGETVLMLVAGSGYLDMVKLFLEKGVDINAKTNRDKTAIMYAAENGHVEVVKLLREKGAKDFNSNTIMYAARNGHDEVVKNLLVVGVDPNTMDIHNETPLMLAAGAGSLEAVKVLLKNGANPNLKHILPPEDYGIELDVKYHNGMTALMYAAGENNYEVMKLLLEYGADPNIADKENETPLILVAKSGSLDVVKMLLAKGADPSAKSDYDWTALMYAAKSGDYEIIKELLNKGANINGTDVGNRSALMCAASAGRLDVVRMFLEKGADPHAKGSGGETALMWAAQNGHSEVVDLLLEKKVDVNTTYHDGKTALTYAVANGYYKIVKTLLQKGADPNVGCNTGKVVLMYAIEKGNYEMVKTLLENGANPNVNYLPSIHYINGNFLVETSWGKVYEPGGITPLIHAIGKDNNELVKLLLKWKAKPDAKGGSDKTALRVAIDGKHGTSVKMLVEAGADYNQVDTDGMSALMAAITKDDIEIVKTLLEAGAEIPAVRSFVHGNCVELSPNNWLVFHTKAEVMAELKKGYCAVKNQFFIDQEQCYNDRVYFNRCYGGNLIGAAQCSPLGESVVHYPARS